MPAKGHRDETKWVTTTCPTCNAAFEFLRSWPRKFCCRKCQGRATVANIQKFTPSRFTTPCEQCGEPFETTPKRTRGRFCSRTCYGSWLSANVRGAAHPTKGKKLGRPTNAGPVITKPCEVCGINFITKASHVSRRRTCSKLCYGALQAVEKSGAKNGNWKGGYEPYYGPTWRKAQREARKRDKVCQDCGKTREQCGRALDVHHITPFRVFGLERHTEANDLSNLISLCQPCHLSHEPR